MKIITVRNGNGIFLTKKSDMGEERRYHLHDTHLRRAIKKAAFDSKLLKRVAAYTFRHCLTIKAAKSSLEM